MIEIERARLDDPELAAFVRAHLHDMAPTAPAESRHALDVDELRAHGLRMWVARSQGRVVGMVGLAPLAEGQEELKSMRTDPGHRGRGIAGRLLDAALDDARARGVHAVLLETGSMDFFAPARRLYERAGFRERGPFGHYRDDPNSVYLQLALTP